MSEWTFEGEIIEKTEPNSSQRCTINGQQPVGMSAAKEFLTRYKEKKRCECFEVLKQRPREVWLSILGAFEI